MNRAPAPPYSPEDLVRTAVAISDPATTAEALDHIGNVLKSTPITFVVIEGERDRDALGQLKNYSKRFEFQPLFGSVKPAISRFEGYVDRDGNRRVIGVSDRDWAIECCPDCEDKLCRRLCALTSLTNQAIAWTDFTDLESDLIVHGVLERVLDPTGACSSEFTLAFDKALGVARELGFLRWMNDSMNLGWTFGESGGSHKRWSQPIAQIIRTYREVDSASLEISDPDTFRAITRILGHPVPMNEAKFEWWSKHSEQLFNGKDFLVSIVDVIAKDQTMQPRLRDLWGSSGIPKDYDRHHRQYLALQRALLQAGSSRLVPDWNLFSTLRTFVKSLPAA